MDHITPDPGSLYWLCVCHRIDFKLLLLVYKALNGLGPQYISDLLLRYEPSRPLRLSGTACLGFLSSKLNMEKQCSLSLLVVSYVCVGLLSCWKVNSAWYWHLHGSPSGEWWAVAGFLQTGCSELRSVLISTDQGIWVIWSIHVSFTGERSSLCHTGLIQIIAHPNRSRQTVAHVESGSARGFFQLRRFFSPQSPKCFLIVGTVGFLGFTFSRFKTLKM